MPCASIDFGGVTMKIMESDPVSSPEPDGRSLLPFIDHLDAKESALMHILTQRVFTNPCRYGFNSGDEAAEAFMRYNARLRTIIRNSGNKEGDGGVYVETCIRFIAKSIHRSHRRREFIDTVLESAGDFCPVLPGDQLKTYSRSEKDDTAEIPLALPANREMYVTTLSPMEKRLLYLSIKCAWEVDDEIIERVSRTLNLPMQWLSQCMYRARLSLEPSVQRTFALIERRNAIWVKLRLAEAQLVESHSSHEEQERLRRNLEMCRKQYRNSYSKRCGSRLLVTNRKIAEILGVPKGSVDSGLYYLKNHVESLACNERAAEVSFFNENSCRNL
jgi:hypothetical protein